MVFSNGVIVYHVINGIEVAFGVVSSPRHPPRVKVNGSISIACLVGQNDNGGYERDDSRTM
jgi:hypothetical protein